MGALSTGRIHIMALRIFRLISATGRMVDLWNRGGLYLWRVEGVS